MSKSEIELARLDLVDALRTMKRLEQRREYRAFVYGGAMDNVLANFDRQVAEGNLPKLVGGIEELTQLTDGTNEAE